MEPTFQQTPLIYLGREDESVVWLPSHDWTAEESTPWNQWLVRKALDKPSATGYWNVKVVEAGEYDIRLRRWPEEADAAIDAPLPPRTDVPGDSPFRASPGREVQAVKASVRIGEVRAEAPVEPGAKEVALQVTPPAGKTPMRATFTTRDGGTVGAFYAYVRGSGRAAKLGWTPVSPGRRSARRRLPIRKWHQRGSLEAGDSLRTERPNRISEPERLGWLDVCDLE